MKRLNPNTGKPFARGDQREDGFYFRGYRSKINKKGYFYEDWQSKFIAPPKIPKPRLEGIERLNPANGKPWKYGDIRLDGYYFSHYNYTRVTKDGYYMESWSEKPLGSKKELAGEKRLNPDTGKPFRMGDMREDGWFFLGYNKTNVRKDGTFTEQWASKDNFDLRLQQMKAATRKNYIPYDPNNPKHKRNVNPKTGKEWARGEYDPDTDLYFFQYYPEVQIETLVARERWAKLEKFIPLYLRGNLEKIRSKCRKKGIPYDIDYDYLISIFPRDMICPALGIKMEFGGTYEDRQNSPSIDRLYPHKGYVKGNIRFVSFLANAIMNEADPDEIIKVGKWLESEGAIKRNMKRKLP